MWKAEDSPRRRLAASETAPLTVITPPDWRTLVTLIVWAKPGQAVRVVLVPGEEARVHLLGQAAGAFGQVERALDDVGAVGGPG